MISDSQREYYRKWRKANRAKMNAYNRQHRKDNLEHYRAKDRARDKVRVRVRDQRAYLLRYREANREALVAKARRRYYKNRDQLLKWKRDHPPDKERKRIYNREWCRKNPAKVQAHRAKRQYAIAATPEELERMNAFMLRMRSSSRVRCHYCGDEIPGHKIDFDHVIPLSRGGKHSLFNICAACEPCNARKYSKLPHEWSKKGQMFLSL